METPLKGACQRLPYLLHLIRNCPPQRCHGEMTRDSWGATAAYHQAPTVKQQHLKEILWRLTDESSDVL